MKATYEANHRMKRIELALETIADKIDEITNTRPEPKIVTFLEKIHAILNSDA